MPLGQQGCKFYSLLHPSISTSQHNVKRKKSRLGSLSLIKHQHLSVISNPKTRGGGGVLDLEEQKRSSAPPAPSAVEVKFHNQKPKDKPQKSQDRQWETNPIPGVDPLEGTSTFHALQAPGVDHQISQNSQLSSQGQHRSSTGLADSRKSAGPLRISTCDRQAGA